MVTDAPVHGLHAVKGDVTAHYEVGAALHKSVELGAVGDDRTDRVIDSIASPAIPGARVGRYARSLRSVRTDAAATKAIRVPQLDDGGADLERGRVCANPVDTTITTGIHTNDHEDRTGVIPIHDSQWRPTSTGIASRPKKFC